MPASDEQLADVLWRANTGGKLTPAEMFQYQVRTNALFRYWEDVHYQYRVGLYDDVEFDKQRAAWGASMAGAPLAQRYWCRVRTYYSPQFMAEMDRIVGPDCDPGGMTADPRRLAGFAAQYTAAWNSRDPAAVGAFFAPDGALVVNGAPAQGRDEITAVAEGFMLAFPDLELTNDRLEIEPDRVTYHWTFEGSNTGPGGTGERVRFSGFEQWEFGADGLIAHSDGHFDDDEYQRQLEHGVD